MLTMRQQLGGLAKAKKINEAYKLNPNKCENCGGAILRNDTKTKLSDIKKKRFCNKKCAALFNNNLRKKPSRCKVCKSEIANKRKRCDVCLDAYVCKVGHVMKKDSTDAKIRSHARTVFRKAVKTVACEKCSFSHFTEICHKKPVATFSLDTPMSVINSLDNLLQLCPNCHWLFDHAKS